MYILIFQSKRRGATAEAILSLPPTHWPGDDVRRAGRRERHDNAYRSPRIRLRPRQARYGWQRDSARGQMQKISAGKFHDGLPEVALRHHATSASHLS